VFIVKAQSDVRETGTTYGPFRQRDEAEQCVIALASRVDIKSATIIEEPK
jgi:hypothetical protein